ncbi:alpha/beta hydrolase [Catellatospora methionotrophica]|uniref:alpha/beta hydrolase n=1 Tax=Catellatospora methionotrophica TaxID=121620 RepID=UPI0033D131D8
MTAPDTIVLIHGLWMTPLSWEHWVEHYTEAGYRVLAPSWPGLEGGVEALRRDPSPLAGLGVGEVADHYERIIADLDRPPIIMGHSFGGALTQILLGRGLGAAGVAINSAQVKGVYRLPLTQLKAASPVLGNPANRTKAVPFTPEQFHYAFTNTLTAEQSRQVYDRYHVPAAARALFQGAFANLDGRSPLAVDVRRDDRAPLLFVAGGADHIVPPSVNRANHRLYRHSSAITDYQEFPGRSHHTVGQDGWQQVADYALAWAVRNAR